jgi:uncharacterized protein YbjT (DUF2867 family)
MGSRSAMILVTGAGGKTGRAVITALARRGAAIRALIHRREQSDALKALGAAEVVIGDMRDGVVAQAAMRDARSVYHICPNVNPDEGLIGNIILRAARAARVEHFVFHSVLHPHTEKMPHHWHKLRVEEALFESGLPFTILQPTAYAQNILAGWHSIVEESVYRVPYPIETRLSLVDMADVAEAAAIVLTKPGHIGATYELVGTPPMTQVEVAEALSQQLGRPVRAAAMPIELWEKSARDSGLSDYALTTLIQMFHYYEHYGLIGNPSVLTWLLKRSPATLAEFIRQHTEAR